jgi:DegV family protein with EDD domain
MAKVAIVTDSTVNLPDSYINEYGIQVAPQVVIWDGVTYQDGIDIHTKEFYERLKNSTSSPTTSQVSIVKFKEVFQSQLDQGNEVLCVTISSRLSGTMNSAIQAKEAFPGAKIELIDSRMASMALGFQVLQAARAAQNGASLSECKSVVERAIQHTGAFFVVETLEYLHRGGRIGNAARFVGTALNLKPILRLQDGGVESAAKVRTYKKAVEKMLNLLDKELTHSRQNRLSVLHAAATTEAEEVLQELKARFSPVELMTTEVSPVIGTHTGPGTIGVAFMRDM